MELGNVSQPTYGPGPEAPGSSVPGLVGMVHGFLRLVQPNALPIELITDFGQSQSEEAIGEQVQELLLYELGFLVCMAIGLLFIILVPLVGCCFCCCRCCGNCGGRMYQKQGRRMGCRRRVLWACVLLVSALLLAGDVCAFVSNTRFSQAVCGTFPNVNNTLDDVRIYVASIPQQINFVIDSSNVPLGLANRSLQDIGPSLGGMIVLGIRRSTDGALGSLQSLLQGMQTLVAAFGSIASTRSRLEELQRNYSRRLASLQDGLNQTLQRCGHPCGSVSLDGLAFSANFSTIPGVERQLEALGDVSGSNIASDLEKVNSTLDTTPAKVQEQSQDVVTKTQDQLGLIRQEIRSWQEQLPFLEVEENIGAFVGNATSVLEEYREPIITLDRLRWSICVLLCCMVLLVVLCNVFGLLMGPLGLKESVLPTQRSSLSNAGGNFFMAGVGFSFIFSWLLMLLVLITFVLGGNIYMLICESWRSQQLFQLLDTPGLIPGFNLSELLGQEGGTANFSEMYRQCQRDTALWQTLHLDQTVSLDELLNISQYTGEISTAFEKMNITLSPISLLSQSQRDLLLNASQAGQPPDFTLTLEQLDQNVTQGSLLDLATELEQLADKGTDVKKDLKADARRLRELDKEMQMSFSGPLQSLKENIHSVQSRAAQLKAQTKAALDKARETQEFLDGETANIIKNETWAFLEELLDFFETYISWAKSRLTGDVARCKPIAQTLDNVEAITCNYILDSLDEGYPSLSQASRAQHLVGGLLWLRAKARLTPSGSAWAGAPSSCCPASSWPSDLPSFTAAWRPPMSTGMKPWRCHPHSTSTKSPDHLQGISPPLPRHRGDGQGCFVCCAFSLGTREQVGTLRLKPPLPFPLCDDAPVCVGGGLHLALPQVRLHTPPTRPRELRAACMVYATTACAAGQWEPAHPGPSLEKRDYLFLQGVSFQGCDYWCQTINGAFVRTVGMWLRSSHAASMEGCRGKGREGSPLLAQAGAVPGTRGLLLRSPSTLCPQPALGALTQPMGQCRTTAQRHWGWVTFPSLGSPLHLWLGGCQVLPWENLHQDPSVSEVPHMLFPAHRHFPVPAGNPPMHHLWVSSEFMGCLQPAPPSLYWVWWHGDFQTACPTLLHGTDGHGDSCMHRSAKGNLVCTCGEASASCFVLHPSHPKSLVRHRGRM